MTKVATIDKRRALGLVMVAAMVIATLLAAMIPTIVSAADNPADNTGQTDGSFDTDDSSSPPVVNSVVLTDTDNVTATSMDPYVEQWIHVKVTDVQTLEHLDYVQVTIYYDAAGSHPAAPTTVDNETCAIITWTPNDTWTLTAMGAGSTWSRINGTTPTLTNNTGWFIFPFVPGKVATETTGSADWDIYAYAHDEASGDGDLPLTGRLMNWRGEISGVTSSVDFGSIALNAQSLASGPVSAKYIANGDYSERAQTDAQWINGSYTIDLQNSGAPPDNHFRLDVNDESNGSPETQVTNTYSNIDSDEGITAEDGVTNGMYLWLTLGPSGIASGSYSGHIDFAIYDR